MFEARGRDQNVGITDQSTTLMQLRIDYSRTHYDRIGQWQNHTDATEPVKSSQLHRGPFRM